MISAVRLFMVMDPQKPAVHLMVKCAVCGAMTVGLLEVAWLEPSIPCSNCGVIMPLAPRVLATLRRQAVDAQAALDKLLSALKLRLAPS